MNDNQDIPNIALRQHVTDHSFVLTMRKSHIATLVALANADRPPRTDGKPDNFITAVRGLEARGLLVHRHKPNFVGKHHGNMVEPITNYYRLTKAGWAVFDLLVEAGFAEAIERKSPKRRLVV